MHHSVAVLSAFNPHSVFPLRVCHSFFTAYVPSIVASSLPVKASFLFKHACIAHNKYTIKCTGGKALVSFH